MAEIYSLLKEHFGYQEFRGQQESVIQTALAGGEALVVMPTGQGKSLCYQLPSMAMPGLTVVLSPLIALMKDQVNAAKKAGLRAVEINSSIGPDARNQRYRGLAEQKYDLILVTPERFRKTEFLEALANNTINLFGR